MKVKFEDTEGRRVREDGRRVLVVWPFTDFDGERNSLRSAAWLGYRWYVVRPAKWSRWYVAEAWDPHGPRRYDMGHTTRPWWWRALWPAAALGRRVHRVRHGQCGEGRL